MYIFRDIMDSMWIKLKDFIIRDFVIQITVVPVMHKT